MIENAEILGEKFRQALRDLKSPLIQSVRGKGLLNAIVIDESKFDKTAWHICLLLKEYGLLAKPTHEVRFYSFYLNSFLQNIIRLAPPLCITEEQLMQGVAIIDKALKKIVTIKLSDIPGIEH